MSRVDKIEDIDNIYRINRPLNEYMFFPIRLLTFFTFWGLVLQGLYYLGILKSYQFSILLLCIVISICGFIITYIHPKYIYIPYINIKIMGMANILFDIMLHQVPLLLFIMRYDKNIERDNGILFLLVILLYLLIFNPFKIYHFLVKKCQRKSN